MSNPSALSQIRKMDIMSNRNQRVRNRKVTRRNAMNNSEDSSSSPSCIVVDKTPPSNVHDSRRRGAISFNSSSSDNGHQDLVAAADIVATADEQQLEYEQNHHSKCQVDANEQPQGYYHMHDKRHQTTTSMDKECDNGEIIRFSHQLKSLCSKQIVKYFGNDAPTKVREASPSRINRNMLPGEEKNTRPETLSKLSWIFDNKHGSKVEPLVDANEEKKVREMIHTNYQKIEDSNIYKFIRNTTEE
jgi:hypothetical protein